MKTFRTAAIALAILASASLNSSAQEFFTANLTFDQETAPPVFTVSGTNPPVARPVSFGDATLVLNASLTQLTMTINVYNIDFGGQTPNDTNDNIRAAHIHAGPTAVLGQNAGVVFGFIGTPFNDNNPNDVVVTPFVNGVGATITAKWDAPEGQNTTLAQHVSNLRNGLSYLNFHTEQNTGGEIRGAIQAVPEPSTTALLIAGAAGAGIAAWRRRRR